MYGEFFARASELSAKDEPFAIAIVVRAEKPTSAKPGDKAIITAQGALHGWVGGSCALPTVVKEAKAALADRHSRLIRLSANPQDQTPREGLIDLPMTCFSGGTLEIYIEPQHPMPRLMVVGNLPIAHALIRLGKVMNYRTIAVDPDADPANMQTEADELITDLGLLVSRITPLTYVVVTTHGNYDEVALEHALRSKAAYVALVASKTRLKAVLDYLSAAGLTPAQLAALKCPAGLDIQAVQAEEIAVSIIAEIVQHRRSAGQIDLAALLESVSPGASEPTQAVDPVCGMAVNIAEAEYVYEHQGHTYYFCSESCKSRFATEPDQYLDQPAPSGEALDPVCGMTVDIASAKYMSEYETQLYYFCGAGCKRSFDKEPEKYVSAANVGGAHTP